MQINIGILLNGLLSNGTDLSLVLQRYMCAGYIMQFLDPLLPLMLSIFPIRSFMIIPICAGKIYNELASMRGISTSSTLKSLRIVVHAVLLPKSSRQVIEI